MLQAVEQIVAYLIRSGHGDLIKVARIETDDEATETDEEHEEQEEVQEDEEHEEQEEQEEQEEVQEEQMRAHGHEQEEAGEAAEEEEKKELTPGPMSMMEVLISIMADNLRSLESFAKCAADSMHVVLRYAASILVKENKLSSVEREMCVLYLGLMLHASCLTSHVSIT